MIEEYRSQVEYLASKLNCKMVLLPNEPGMMYVEYSPPEIWGPSLEDIGTEYWGYTSNGKFIYPNLQSRYMTILHELGHVSWGHTQGRPGYEGKQFYFDNGVLKSEAQAWEFALVNSIDDKINEETQKFMQACFGSYISSAISSKGQPYRLMNGNRHHVEFVFDEPDDYVKSIYNRLGGDFEASFVKGL